MKKKLFNWMLAATALVGMNMGFTSCSDDDDDKDNQQQEQQAQEQQDAFWYVVGQLAGQSAFTEDYQNATFEPIIGQPLSETNTYVRVVPTNDMATAAMRFANLVNKSDIDENTTSYNWHDDAVGTLSYKKTTDGTSLATVDVDIKQMPHLQQIIYRTPEQSGDNGSFKGTAYYRFGDVISNINSDNNTEYWICVRPAFGLEGKEDSHWICISPLPKENRWTKNTDGYSYELPTGLGSSKEHMQNLAEMLYAITTPTSWYACLDKSTPMFHDFSIKNMEYHSDRFWERVADAWEKHNFWKAFFGLNSATSMWAMLTNKGLHLLYNGKWWTLGSSDFSLYQAVYKNGQGKKQNMHEATYKTVKNRTTSVGNFIISELCTKESPDIVHEKFFGDSNPRYVVRYATGKELAGVTPSVYASLCGSINQLKDIYTYNLTYHINPGTSTSPEKRDDIKVESEQKPDENQESDDLKPVETPEVGQILCSNGKVYKTSNAAFHGDNYGVALVAYRYRAADKIYPDESSYCYNMGISLGALKEVTWGTIGKTENIASKVCGTTIDQDTDYKAFLNTRNGYKTTETLFNEYKSGDSNSHYHDAATRCWNYWDYLLDGDYQIGGNLKEHWHLPSVGQWYLFLQAIGAWDLSNKAEVQGKIKEIYLKAGITDTDAKLPYQGTFWTSTEKSATEAYVLIIDNNGAYFRTQKKNEKATVFPFILF